MSEKEKQCRKEEMQDTMLPPQNVLTTLPPKQHRPISHNSPLKRIERRSLRGSMESLTSDMSMDLSDITLEIEKLSTVIEDPEKTMQNTNRLLKEIDQQMEISFEIMEERQNMVREYLHEREKAERGHRNRANKIMKTFTDKMGDIEGALGMTQAEGKSNRSCVTQTEVIESKDECLQTSETHEIESNNLQEAVQALTQDMKHVVEKQLLKEKVLMIQELEARKNEIDIQEIDTILAGLHHEIDLENESMLVGKAREIVNKIIDEELDSSVKSDLKYVENELVEYLVKDENYVIVGLSKNVLALLDKIKKLYSEEKERLPVEALVNTGLGTPTVQIDNMLELRSVCRHIDLLESSLDSVVSEIQNNLNLNETILETEFAKLLTTDGNKRNEEISKFVDERTGTMEDSTKKETEEMFVDAVKMQEELNERESALKEVLQVKFVDLNNDRLRRQVVNVSQRNKSLVKEKAQLLRLIHSQGTDTDDVIKVSTKFYIEPIHLDEEEQESMENLLKVEPKIGTNLVNNLLTLDLDSDTVAANIVNYQEKPLENVLADYENEMNELSENFNKISSYQEVVKLADSFTSPLEAVSALAIEKEKVHEELQDHKAKATRVRQMLKALKLQKYKSLLNEKNLSNQKCILQSKLKEINKQVADMIMQKERGKEKSNVELRIATVASEINDLQTNMEHVDLRNQLQNLQGPGKEDNKKILLSNKLEKLKEDLGNLSPFINKNSQKYNTDNKHRKIPSSEEVEEVVQSRKVLSSKLLETECRIQEIITSKDYESSCSGSLENIEELQSDVSFAKSDLIDKGFRAHNPNLDLNDKLLEIEMELDHVNKEMQDKNLRITDLENLKSISKELEKTLDEIERKLKSSSQIPRPFDANRQLKSAKEEIRRLKQKLKLKGVKNIEYDSEKIARLEKSKAKYEDKVNEIREEIISDKLNGGTLCYALSGLLQERDRTKNIIMDLDEDIVSINDIESTLSGYGTMNERLVITEKQLLDKKTEHVTKLVWIAKQRLREFIENVKAKMKLKLEEAKENNWQNKQKLTREEKGKLGKELKDIIGDIKQTQTEIKEIKEFKTNGYASTNDQSLLKTLSNKKRELLSALEQINNSIEKEVSSNNESELLEQLLKEKVNIKEQLMDLDERIEGQDNILKERLQKVIGIKHGLENKMADCVDIEDLKKIISALEKKENITIFKKENGEKGVDALMKERLSLHKNILHVLQHTPVENGKAKKIIKILEVVDADISNRVEAMMKKLNEIDEENNENEVVPVHVLANAAITFEFLQDKAELLAALNVTNSSKFIDTNLKKGTEEIKELQRLKNVIEKFQGRKIEVTDLADLKELKSLNEEKLERLLTKIKNLNLLMDKQKNLNKQQKKSKQVSPKVAKTLSATKEIINKELESLIRSYDEDIKRNEEIMKTKPYLHISPTQSVNDMNVLLEKRDDKLNEMFLIEKELESLQISDIQRGELNDEKERLEKEIEEMDEKIIDGDFITSSEDVGLASPTRSFSPRSTSSRNSFMLVLDERDQLLRKIFRIQKHEERLRESEDTLNKMTNLEDLKNHKEELRKSLKNIDDKILKFDSCDTDVTMVDSSQDIFTKQCMTDDDVRKEINNLSQDLKNGTIRIHESGNDSVALDLNELIIDPAQTEILNTIQSIDEQLNIEKFKRKVFSLESERKVIEENLRERKSPDRTLLKQEENQLKAKVSDTQSTVNLLVRKQELENEITILKEKIDKNEKKREHLEHLSHKEFIKNETVVTVKELKRNKIAFEEKLDELNIIINQYSNTIELEIAAVETDANRYNETELMKPYLKDEIDVLQNHKNDLEQLQSKLTFHNDFVLSTESEITLPSLLIKRRETINEIEKVMQIISAGDNTINKDAITMDIRIYYEEEKKCLSREQHMEHKLKFLDEKIEELNAAESKYITSDSLMLKSILGENLLNVLQDSQYKPEESYLKDLKLCIEDRTVSQYIKDLTTLCTLQSEQLDHLKNTVVPEDGELLNSMKENEELGKMKEIMKTKDKLIIHLNEELEGRETDIAIKTREHDEIKKVLEKQIQQTEKELNNLASNMEKAEILISRFKSKLGDNLYEIIKETHSTEGICNYDTKTDRYLENLKTILHQNEATLEEIMQQNFKDLENTTKENEEIRRVMKKPDEDKIMKLNEDNEIKDIKIQSLKDLIENHGIFAEQLKEEKKILKKQLCDKEDQLELLKRREDDLYSETESLRDDLQQCARKTSFIHEEATKLKDDNDAAKGKMELLTEENKKLKEIVRENEDKVILNEQCRESTTHEFKELKSELTKSNEDMELLKQSKKHMQNELESYRKKCKRMNQEKRLLQENLQVEIKNMEMLQGDLNTLQQKEKSAKHEMHKNCQVIEKQENEMKKIREAALQLEQQNDELQNTVTELKDKYQTLSLKYQTENTKTSKELRSARNKIEEHKMEIAKHSGGNSDCFQESLMQITRSFEAERLTHTNTINDLKSQLEEASKKNANDNNVIADLSQKINKTQFKNEELNSENTALLKKLQDLDESFENELHETRIEMNEKHNKTIDKLNKKIRDLANQLIDVEHTKDELENERNALKTEKTKLQQNFHEQTLISDEKERTQRIKLSAVDAEVQGLRFENSDLHDEIINLKSQLKKRNTFESYEQQLKEQKQQLIYAVQHFEEEKNQFEENVQAFMKTPKVNQSTTENNTDYISLKLLKTSQQEREKISDELIKVNRQLIDAKNELRKVKASFRQKEQDYKDEEKQLLSNLEDQQKHKIDDLQRSNQKDKEKIIKLYNEERNKWEEEMDILKKDLQAENLKKLAEQRLDFEKELKGQINQCIKEMKEELEELLDKNESLKNEKTDMLKQFENEKLKLIKMHQSERFALEETVSRLLRNLMHCKEQRMKLKYIHQDEINELEERFDAEKERLNEHKEEEMEFFKQSIRQTYSSTIEQEKHLLHQTLEDIIYDTPLNKHGPIRTKPEKECDAEDLSLNDLKDLLHMGDLKDILDSEYEEEKEMIKQNMREQYEVKLRRETDSLMKRLLQLSEELDAVRSTS